MKKMMMIATVLFMVASSQAASLFWGSGTTQLKTSDGLANLTGRLVQLLVWNDGASDFIVADTTTTGTVNPNKGKFSGSWTGSDTVAYAVATYPVGTDFFFRVFDTADSSGNHMDVYKDGINGAGSVYWTTTSVTDIDGAQTVNMSDSFYGATLNFVAVPEPTSMALLALGAAAMGLRRKFRK